MWDTFRKLYDILNVRERRQAVLLLILTLFVALAESTRVASVLPFVAVLSDPAAIHQNQLLSFAYNLLGFQSTDQYLIFLGLGLFAIVVCTLSLTALLSWASLRFAGMRHYRLSSQLFEGYLGRAYEWFLARNSSELGTTLLSEVNQVISNALSPALGLVVNCIICAFLIITLFWVDPILAIIVGVGVAAGYGTLFKITQRYLARIGHGRWIANIERFRVSSEALSAIKEVKVLGLESAFLRRFAAPSRRFITFQIAGDALSQVPIYGMQILAFAIILAIISYEIFMRGEHSQALPIIAVYVVAGHRLMQTAHAIYQAGSKMRYAKPGLDSLYCDLVEGRRVATGSEIIAAVEPLGLRNGIELRGVSYAYPAGAAPALNDVSMTIPAHCTVGVVGQTGAGKTTLVDILLGLLQPTTGALRIDGQLIIDHNRRAWQRSTGYVPQQVFISDDTVAANIAFGVAGSDIDMAAVERAACIANIDEFIRQELKNGYDTVLGERGIRLSGGQRQRIGIARAIYRDPDLLIMDEGTSALDNIVERAVMEAVKSLATAKTIILIAHRLTTVRNCELVFLLERGRITASGTYDELINKSQHFRALTAAATN
jgi:ABC-type bacteriocin/lantibiotic exporter with double-glycine peptidase domain